MGVPRWWSIDSAVEALPCGSRSMTSTRRPVLGQRRGHVHGGRGLADPALLVGDHHDPGLVRPGQRGAAAGLRGAPAARARPSGPAGVESPPAPARLGHLGRGAEPRSPASSRRPGRRCRRCGWSAAWCSPRPRLAADPGVGGSAMVARVTPDEVSRETERGSAPVSRETGTSALDVAESDRRVGGKSATGDFALWTHLWILWVSRPTERRIQPVARPFSPGQPSPAMTATTGRGRESTRPQILRETGTGPAVGSGTLN